MSVRKLVMGLLKSGLAAMCIIFFLTLSSYGQYYNTLYKINGTAADDYFGFSVGMIGDINGDGKAEFIVGAYLKDTLGIQHTGVAYVFSGAYKASDPNKGVLYTKTGAGFDQFGYSVAGVGDVDGDGTPDFALGAPFVYAGTLEDAGKIYIYSGLDGSLTRTKAGLHSLDQLGTSVSGGGNMDGDVYAIVFHKGGFTPALFVECTLSA